jgi:hypothetical protein
VAAWHFLQVRSIELAPAITVLIFLLLRYDVDALRVKYTEQERSWGHFFTRLFAVYAPCTVDFRAHLSSCSSLGGTYVVLGLLYDMLDALVGKVRRRGRTASGDVSLPN